MKKCKLCGCIFDGKSCPKCGVKVKKPWYKSGWLWFVLALIIVVIACCCDDSDDCKNNCTNNCTNTDSSSYCQICE